MSQEIFQAKRYANEVAQRITSNKTPEDWKNIDVFRGQFPPGNDNHRYLESTVGQRFETNIRPQLSEDLAERAADLFDSVLALRQWRLDNQEAGLQVPDADLIQTWVLQQVQPHEFPAFVPPAFAEWSERLCIEQQVPHIAQANHWIAKIAVDHFSERGQTNISLADLGAGAGSTILALRKASEENGIQVEIRGVDLTPSLVEIARERTGLNIETANMLEWLEKQPDGSLDLITSVYATHHLHYDDQEKLYKLAKQKLRQGGLFAIADPTGQSKFNLENLDIKEPEAVIACFNPNIVKVAEKLQEIGFSIPYTEEEREVNTFDVLSTQQGFVLDQGTLGHAIVVIK